MTVLQVLTVPDPRLRIKAQPVATVDDSIRRLMEDMLETMYAEEGCGLAATQVGINKRVIVMDVSEKEDLERTGVFKIANPEILWHSEEQCTETEGCLSVPEQRGDVPRFTSIKLRYLDENNTQQEIVISDFLARCVQHEIDHLDGKLYIDYLPAIRRKMMIQKVKRLKRSTSSDQQHTPSNI